MCEEKIEGRREKRREREGKGGKRRKCENANRDVRCECI